MTIKTFFPDWDRPKLEKIAVRHAIEVNSCYDRDPDYSKTERLVVNMLRHEFTDYDNEQSASRFIAACTAIAAHYPWLSDECHHQIAKRRKTESERTAHLQMAQEMRDQEHQENRQRSDASATAISSLYIGQTVRGRVRGIERVGEITWIGTRRVEFSFRIATGQERRYRLYASEVTPVVQHARRTQILLRTRAQVSLPVLALTNESPCLAPYSINSH